MRVNWRQYWPACVFIFAHTHDVTQHGTTVMPAYSSFSLLTQSSHQQSFKTTSTDLRCIEWYRVKGMWNDTSIITTATWDRCCQGCLHGWHPLECKWGMQLLHDRQYGISVYVQHWYAFSNCDIEVHTRVCYDYEVNIFTTTMRVKMFWEWYLVFRGNS